MTGKSCPEEVDGVVERVICGLGDVRLYLLSDAMKPRCSACDRFRVGKLICEGLRRLFEAIAEAAEFGVELVEGVAPTPWPVEWLLTKLWVTIVLQHGRVRQSKL